MYTNFTLLSASDNINQAFEASLQTIQSYVSWIENQQSIGTTAPDNVLTAAKVHANAWTNIIYPTYEVLPNTILSKDDQIEADINGLIYYKEQLQNNDTPKIRQSISQCANNLIQILNILETETQNLINQLSSFRINLSNDTLSFQGELNDINNQIIQTQNQIAKLKGQLHALQNATCKNDKEIKACQKQITTEQNSLNQYQNLATEFSKGANDSYQSSLASAYLQSFWETVKSDIDNCTGSLQDINNNPTTLLTIDISTVEQNWANSKSLFIQLNEDVKSI